MNNSQPEQSKTFPLDVEEESNDWASLDEPLYEAEDRECRDKRANYPGKRVKRKAREHSPTKHEAPSTDRLN